MRTKQTKPRIPLEQKRSREDGEGEGGGEVEGEGEGEHRQEELPRVTKNRKRAKKLFEHTEFSGKVLRSYVKMQEQLDYFERAGVPDTDTIMFFSWMSQNLSADIADCVNSYDRVLTFVHEREQKMQSLSEQFADTVKTDDEAGPCRVLLENITSPAFLYRYACQLDVGSLRTLTHTCILLHKHCNQTIARKNACEILNKYEKLHNKQKGFQTYVNTHQNL